MQTIVCRFPYSVPIYSRLFREVSRLVATGKYEYSYRTYSNQGADQGSPVLYVRLLYSVLQTNLNRTKPTYWY